MSDGAAQRPGGLTAICIIAIALGTLCICCNLINGGTLALQDRLTQANEQLAQGQHDPALRRGQQELNQEMAAYARAWMPAIASLTFLALLGYILVLAGGVLALNLKAGGRALLTVASIGMPLFEVGRTIVEAIYSHGTSEIVARSMQSQMALASAEHGGAGAGIASGMSAGLAFGGVLGTAVLVTWALAKIIYFGVTFFYLRKPEVRALYG